jgi:general nucleoside transport system ATP-binding protein
VTEVADQPPAASPEAAPPAIECRGVTRHYAGVLANDHVDLTVAEGEVHALVGENGAGKSTLMKMIYGLEHPDAGEILVRGQPQRIDSPRKAIALGIGMVHQHFMLIDAFTVAENVVLGSEPGRGGRLDLAEGSRRVGELARGFGTPLDPDARVDALAVGQQQRVEILKLLYRGADILILDEPTAVLVPQEVEDLFDSMRELRAQGKTIIFIAHSLDEVLEIADRITVLRDGKVIGTLDARGATKEQVAEMMVGRPVLLRRVEGTTTPGQPLLQVKDLRVLTGQREALAGVDLLVRHSEIYGLAGVEGNGQAELVEALVGLRRADRGRVYLDDEDLTGADVRTRREHGLAYIPEDRHARGMVLQMLLWENSVLGQQERRPFSVRGLLNPRAMRQQATRLVARFRIKAPSISAPAYALSGGNQQKLILAREFAAEPKLLLAAYPTRGLDIGATEFVWQQLVTARDAGLGVLLISANLEEILALSDRVGVIHDGRIVAELSGSEATMSELGLFMTGAKEQGEPGTGAPEDQPEGSGEPGTGAPEDQPEAVE